MGRLLGALHVLHQRPALLQGQGGGWCDARGQRDFPLLLLLAPAAPASPATPCPHAGTPPHTHLQWDCLMHGQAGLLVHLFPEQASNLSGLHVRNKRAVRVGRLKHTRTQQGRNQMRAMLCRALAVRLKCGKAGCLVEVVCVSPTPGLGRTWGWGWRAV